MSESPFVGDGRKAIVKGLLEMFDRVRETNRPFVVSLEAPLGWGKTRIAQEFYRQLAEMQRKPRYWPDSIAETVNLQEGSAPGECRKRVYPESWSVPAGALPEWFWWGISCSSGRSTVPSLALGTDLNQFWEHKERLEQSWRSSAALKTRAKQTIKDNLGTGINAVGGEAANQTFMLFTSMSNLVIPASGLIVAGVGKAGKAGWNRFQNYRRCSVPSEVDATALDATRISATASDLLRLSLEIPIVVFVEDFDHADPQLLELLSRLVRGNGSILVVVTSWPGFLDRKGERDEKSTLEHLVDGAEALDRVVRIATTGDPIEHFPAGAGLCRLPEADHVTIVTALYPRADIETAQLFAERYANPLALEVALGIPTIRNKMEAGTPISREEIYRLPEAVMGLYRKVWDEFPDSLKATLTLAMLGIPDEASAEHGFDDTRWDSEILANTAADPALPCSLSEGPPDVSEILVGEALKYECVREVGHPLWRFQDPILRRVVGPCIDDFWEKATVYASMTAQIDLDEPLPDDLTLHRARLIWALLQGRAIGPSSRTLQAGQVVLESLMNLPGESVLKIDTATLLLECSEGVAAEDRLSVADAFAVRNNIAWWQAESGHLDEAIAGMERLLSDMERVATEQYLDDVNVFLVRNNLAMMWRDQGDMDQALVELRALLSDETAALRKDDPLLLRCRNDLSLCLAEVEPGDSSIFQFRTLLVDHRRVFGSRSRETLTVYNNLAKSLWDGGQPKEAISEGSELLSEVTKEFGEDDELTLAVRENLAMWRFRDSDSTEETDGAVDILTDALARKERIYGDDHPEVASTRENLAALWLSYADLRYLGEIRELLGDEHPATFAGRGELVRLLDRDGDTDAAIAEAQSLLQSLQNCPGNNDELVIGTANNLLRFLVEGGQLEEAIEALPFLVESLKVAYGEHDGRTRDAIGLLAALRSGGSVALAPRDQAAASETLRKRRRQGRNDPCSCGSGKKFKRCCGRPGVR